MNPHDERLDADIVIVGAGPVGLLCAELARRCGLRAIIVDRSEGPLEVGRADALNARTLQLLELADLFEPLYALGKPCKTSSVWSEGRFVSRQSAWWDELEGCFHKHFLMLGQSHLEKALDERLTAEGLGVRRATSVADIEVSGNQCRTTLASGEVLRSKFVIGADGSRSFVRERFGIGFALTRPRLTWAVIDGVLETDFPKVPEIIVFQNETSDVAWIPREGSIDRFYVRMDHEEFTIEDAIAKIQRAVRPRALRFREVTWFSRFSVKESVAERFSTHERVFLAGDACHVHSVNGGQGLNTGIGDAFNLVWKIAFVLNHGAPTSLLASYEAERKPVANAVVETSGALVRATKFSADGTHAKDYVDLVRRRSGFITGMGVRYGDTGPVGERLHDFELRDGDRAMRIYQLLDCAKYTLLLFTDDEVAPTVPLPPFVRILRIGLTSKHAGPWSLATPYEGQAVLVRPDSYVAAVQPIGAVGEIAHYFASSDGAPQAGVSR